MPNCQVLENPNTTKILSRVRKSKREGGWNYHIDNVSLMNSFSSLEMDYNAQFLLL